MIKILQSSAFAQTMLCGLTTCIIYPQVANLL